LAAFDSFPVRLVSGIVGAAIIVGIVLGGSNLGLGTWPLAGMLAVISGVAAWELLSIIKERGLAVGRVIGTAFAAMAPLAVQVKADDGMSGTIVAALAALLLWLLFDKRATIEAAAVSLLGVGYVGLLLGCLVLVGQLETFRGLYNVPTHILGVGLAFVLVAFFGTWVFDVFAYLVGTAIGKHRLAPSVSPHKSWEGLAGGAVATVLLFAWAPGLGSVWRDTAMGLGQRIALGGVLVVAATLGDLVESRIKREFHTKDSGTIIPGHGGMLDRFDSMLFVAPAIYIALRLLGWT
jgi:phosphatidate cytidylyltransferase